MPLLVPLLIITWSLPWREFVRRDQIQFGGRSIQIDRFTAQAGGGGGAKTGQERVPKRLRLLIAIREYQERRVSAGVPHNCEAIWHEFCRKRRRAQTSERRSAGNCRREPVDANRTDFEAIVTERVELLPVGHFVTPLQSGAIRAHLQR
jgi:hypothetical protein